MECCAPETRTMGAFINFGADVVEPGVVHFGGRGAVVVGELDGEHLHVQRLGQPLVGPYVTALQVSGLAARR